MVARYQTAVATAADGIDGREPSSFGEVIAYLSGIADACSAFVPAPPPGLVSLVPTAVAVTPHASVAPPSAPRNPAGARATLRYGGAMPSVMPAVWARWASAPPSYTTRGGARLL